MWTFGSIAAKPGNALAALALVALVLTPLAAAAQSEPAPTLSIDSPSVTEGDSGQKTLTFTVTLSPASAQQATVDYADAGTGTAVSGTDYVTLSGGTLTFAAGTTSRTFDVSVTGDTVDESDETILVTLSNASGATISTTAGTGTGTVTDDDPPMVTLALAASSIAENGGTTTVTATLSSASSADTTVTVTAVSGFTTVGSDATIAIAAGETANTADSVTITAVDDDIDNVTARTATVSASASNSQGIGGVTGATLTLTDDEDTPTATLALSPATIDESGAGNSSTVTATLSGKSSEAVTLTVAATGATAAAGDFTLSGAKTLTIAAKATTSTGTVTVTANDDTTDEAAETVTVSATVSGTSGVANPTSRTLTIADDDPPMVTLALAASSIAENAGTTTVTATLSSASSADTTVTVTAASGFYTVGTDATIAIAAGETANTADSVTITAVDDDIDNVTARTATVSASASNSQGIGGVTGATLTLTDDEDTPTATLALSPATIAESGAGNATTVTASLSDKSSAAVTLTVAVAGATATAGDFTLSSAKTLTIAAEATTSAGTVTVTANDDTTDEADETVTVGAAVSGTSGVANPTSRTLTIADNDPAPSLSIDSPSVTEGDSGSKNLTFTVTLSAASGKRVTVDYVDAGGGRATPGTDYTAIAGGTLTFAAGTTSQTFNVSVMGDTDGERNEDIRVTLRNATNATIATARGTGTITDDDTRHTVSIDSPTVEERNSGSRMLAFALKLSRAHEQTVFAYLRDAGTGTATAGTDHTSFAPRWVRFRPGETEKTVSISVTGDTVKEPDETVVLEIVAVWRNLAAISTRFGTGTITDDDTTPGLSISSPRVTEGNSGSATLTYAVTLSAAISEQVTVDYADAGTGTATSGTDYTVLAGGTLTFAANETRKTIAVSVTGDTTVEPHETVAVRLSNASGATILTATGAGTIANDDGASSISISSPTMVEGTGEASSLLRFTVTLSRARSQEVVVDLRDALTGTASPGRDYADFRGGPRGAEVRTRRGQRDVRLGRGSRFARRAERDGRPVGRRGP